MKKVVSKNVKKKMSIEDLAAEMQQQFIALRVDLKSYIDNEVKGLKSYTDSEMISLREYINSENLSISSYMQSGFAKNQLYLSGSLDDIKDLKKDMELLKNMVRDLESIIGTQNFSNLKLEISTIQTKINQLSKLDVYVKSGHHDDEIKQIKLDLQNLTTRVNQLQVA